jgi:hypothetical protein
MWSLSGFRARRGGRGRGRRAWSGVSTMRQNSPSISSTLGSGPLYAHSLRRLGARACGSFCAQRRDCTSAGPALRHGPALTLD